MDFKDQIIQLSEKIAKQKDNIATEEATKTSFIMPMISALGYDVFNPFEFVPEMDCDLTKRGDKIDYAIMKDNTPILLIECKHCKQNLDLHSTQLAKYYAASNARFGVLTNGVEYRFYADLEKQNIMDEKPFLIVDMLDLSDSDIEQLKKFHKSYYNEQDILSTAQELQITIQIKDLLNKNFQQPGDEFTRYFVKCLNDWKSSSKLIEQYRPILKKSIASVINDIIADRLNVAMKTNEDKVIETVSEEGTSCEKTVETAKDLPNGIVFQDEEKGIITTQEEIDAYNIVRSILRQYVDVKRIQYKDHKSYFAINIDGSTWWWICRIYIGKRNRRIGFPKNGYKDNEWIDIESLDDIFNYAERLKSCLDIALGEANYWKNKK
ncbi:type I restriction endonuclease [uncultured Bacteroides sp.]|uniref:type I restriction endonuclease n=1 Tax=uncultured Bacteroides sp. TaxID=162156 RepID=UPI002606AC32|nr:type I restriction endonuclease [uncultured Bacteroides sp.]